MDVSGISIPVAKEQLFRKAIQIIGYLNFRKM
jgi:hypothetical protein